MGHFLDHQAIYDILRETERVSDHAIDSVLEKAKHKKGLGLKDIAVLLQATSPRHLEKINAIAAAIKNDIYGNRVVIFAPLYISNYCVNNCTYCGYRRDNVFARRRLTDDEIRQEVRILERMGHKRLALEVGEDPVHCDLDYVLNAIRTIYDESDQFSAIRRINVNIAATSTDNYRRLKEASIGTYILFQETYHQPTYEGVHPKSLKGDYPYHLTAFDRAMEAGIDDVGAGVLFGLYDHRFEVLALMMHHAHLEETYGVGFHTVSVPRLKKAEGVDVETFHHLVDDETFKKIVAILRLAMPYTGIILSTRENRSIRNELIHHGVSQISAGSCTGVGGYKEEEDTEEVMQFEIADERSTLEIVRDLMDSGFIPSFCTSCYRMGRTGDRFMTLAKSGCISKVCQPNALLTLKEFCIDFGSPLLNQQADVFISEELMKVSDEVTKKRVTEGLKSLSEGKRDIYI